MVGGGRIFPVHLLDLDFVSGETVDNSKRILEWVPIFKKRISQ